MTKSFLHDKGDVFLLQSEQASYFMSQSNPPSPSNIQSNTFIFNDKVLKVSPSILLIIIILAIVFFISGLLNLLVRFLCRAQHRDPHDLDNVTALQGQLQQLFHLHDAGVDQSFIDTLPVFNYKAIIGLEDPFDCAVCLCEFEPEDKLRLLPKCSHAFHMECIDTWLMSHSTCPLCRACLIPEFSSNNTCPPFVFVLESGSESSREICLEREGTTTASVVGRTSSVITANSCFGGSEFGSTRTDLTRKSGDLISNENPIPDSTLEGYVMEKVVTVKLGKFRNVDGDVVDCGEGSSSTNNIDDRRCFSMGSFSYVMDESSSLQVPIRTSIKKQSSEKKCVLPLIPGPRLAMSECDFESKRDFKFAVSDDASATSIGKSRKESFSVSKIWLRGNKEKPNAAAAADSSRRAVSLRYPAAVSDDLKAKNGKFDTRSTISEMDIGKWENGGNEFGYDEENQSCL
ncbi:hypothetical protein TanjilG_13405 [Lupinus angustifolius]|uniref:RING-type E3 ubiquitin transferase n=1 Tax=Lupinus angustifolius TaxID=3871 RepID=A0A4P1RV53_LUPAN|nr:hypothetical protein TanjilG_13405 [Lupinus angustifolius]